jgi:hypothetical protein
MRFNCAEQLKRPHSNQHLQKRIIKMDPCLEGIIFQKENLLSDLSSGNWRTPPKPQIIAKEIRVNKGQNIGRTAT